MAYLTEKEKSILFAAIHREENVCKEHGYDDLVQVCKRLTFLFSYNRFEKDIRNKAIDEFVEILVRNKNYVVDECYGYTIPLSEFYKIAEHMKGE